MAKQPNGHFCCCMAHVLTVHTEDCLCGEKKIVLHFIAKNHSLYHCGTYEYSLS